MSLSIRYILIICFTAIISVYAVSSFAQEIDRDPESATGVSKRELVKSKRFMVAAANPYAVEVGYNILKQGGSAIDALIAVNMALTLVEPHSSGLGGGSFIVYWDNEKQKLTTFDGRETAPQAAKEDLFIGADGNRMDFLEALSGGRAVGAPGLVRNLELAHEQYGKLPWEALFKDSIALAENGFEVSPRLHQSLLDKRHFKLMRYDSSWNYFFPGGDVIMPGQVLKNPELADTLRRIALAGSKAFYKGDIAIDIVAAVQDAKDNPGLLTLEDMANYQAKEREPICATYREYKVCGMGPPTSGGMTVIQILSLLSHTDIDQQKPLSEQAVHLFAQAGRLAYADRDKYMADADFVDVPVKGLIDQGYLKQRAALIDPEKDPGKASAGAPPGATAFGIGFTPTEYGTTHIAIVDAQGNAVSSTATIEHGFGSGIMVRGFLLNNEITDFSFNYKDDDGQPIANRVEGGKRPRSSMSPTIIFDADGKPKVIVGSPGGSRIIAYVAQTLLGVLDWGLNIQEAIDMPHYLHRNSATLDVEKGTELEALAEGLEQRGYQVKVRDLNSGLHGIVVTADGLEGGADPRREGTVMGD